MEEISLIVSEMSDAELVQLSYDLAEEIEARLMARAGEPAAQSKEGRTSLPF